MRTLFCIIMSVFFTASLSFAQPLSGNVMLDGVNTPLNTPDTGRDTGIQTKQQSEKKYYEDQKRGWWWYEKAPVVKEENKNDKYAAKGQKQLPSLKDYTTEEIFNMHPDQFRVLWVDIRDKAVQNPSDENIKDFYLITDIAATKSLQFTNAYTAFVQKNPDVAMDFEYPTNTPGDIAKGHMQKGEVKKMIDGASADYALIYFYSEGCEFCQEQSNIMKYFKASHSMEIKPIEISRNPDVAAFFKVTTVPHIVLVYKYNKDDSIPISTGIIDMVTMEERIYRGMRLLKGETTEESFSLYKYLEGSGMDPNTERWKERQQRRGLIDK